MQKLLTLAITAAIIYFIVEIKKKKKIHSTDKANNPSVSASTGNQQATNVPELSGNFFEKTLSGVLINVLKTEEGRLFLENILQPMNKPLTGENNSFKINNANLLKSLYRINTFGEGTTGPAVCGHIVTVNYQILTLSNDLVEEKAQTYTLGSRPVMPGLDTIIVGMMTGQTRHATIPAAAAFHKNNNHPEKAKFDINSAYKVNVTLKALIPNNFIKDDEVKIFDDEIAYRLPLTCGDKAQFNAKITNISNGKLVYDSSLSSKKLNVKIGDITYPMIFSYALHNKIPVGTRTVIAKGKSFYSLANKVSPIFPKDQLPPEQYFLLELSDFQTE